MSIRKKEIALPWLWFCFLRPNNQPGCFNEFNTAVKRQRVSGRKQGKGESINPTFVRIVKDVQKRFKYSAGIQKRDLDERKAPEGGSPLKMYCFVLCVRKRVNTAIILCLLIGALTYFWHGKAL